MKPDHQSDAPSIPADLAFWDKLPVHPAAEMLPMMNDEEIKELAADIDKNGLLEPVDIFVDNTEAPNGVSDGFPLSLLEGRNRKAALKLLGTCPAFCGGAVRELHALKKSKGKWITDCDPYAYVLSKNVHRRHLTAEQKRDAIAAYIKAQPRTSNRKIAKALKLSPTTVGEVRDETVPNVQTGQMEHKPIERAKAAVRENPDASVTELAAAANVGRATIQRAQHLVKAEGKPKPEPSEPEPTSEPEPAIAVSSRVVTNRKDLINEVAADVARALNDLWQKWCAENSDVDWPMFTAAVRRFLKSGAEI